MYSKLICGTLSGLSAEKVFVESDVACGFPSFYIVGLADAAIKESKERVRAAVSNSGFPFPQERVTVNLSPADRKKEGTHFDLPVALSILSAGGKLRFKKEWMRENWACLGELTLDGRLVRIRGLLPMLIDLKAEGIEKLILPEENLEEALAVSGIILYPAKNLREAADHLCGSRTIAERRGDGEAYLRRRRAAGKEDKTEKDFSEVLGQETAKRAMQISASAMHNILMIGSPGTGKSMLAQRLPGILPPLSYDEMIELTKIYSISGLLDVRQPLMTSRPFRCPDTKVTPAALAGGGKKPMPGEVSLAHLGVLFLDETPEFSRESLETLRGPMETETVTISRTGGRYIFPAKFLTAAAMNPCPCGYAFDPSRECTCTESQIRHYWARLSGPFLDRIDLFIHVNSPVGRILPGEKSEISSEQLKKGVLRARRAQKERFRTEKIRYNSQMSSRHLEKYCRLDRESERLLEEAYEKLRMSSRSCSRVLRVARTIADIEDSEEIRFRHLAEAITYKAKEWK